MGKRDEPEAAQETLSIRSIQIQSHRQMTQDPFVLSVRSNIERVTRVFRVVPEMAEAHSDQNESVSPRELDNPAQSVLQKHASVP